MNTSSLKAFIDMTCNETNSRFSEHGEIEPLGIEGVTGRISSIDSFALNCVGHSTLTEEAAEETIKKVINRYAERSKNFTWIVGPSSSPINLGDMLEKSGLIKVDPNCMAGMYMPVSGPLPEANEEVIIEKKGISKLHEYAALAASAYGFGESPDAHYIRSKLIANSGDHGDLYLAFYGGSDEPVAYGVSVYYEKERIVILQGSATIRKFRGKGIYTSLVAARMKDAKLMGMETAVIQAIKSTSMPICQKIGFQKISDIDLYAYGLANEEHLRRVMSGSG